MPFKLLTFGRVLNRKPIPRITISKMVLEKAENMRLLAPVPSRMMHLDRPTQDGNPYFNKSVSCRRNRNFKLTFQGKNTNFEERAEHITKAVSKQLLKRTHHEPKVHPEGKG